MDLIDKNYYFIVENIFKPNEFVQVLFLFDWIVLILNSIF